MAARSWAEILGVDASASLNNGEMIITFKPNQIPNGGLNGLTPTTSNAPEKVMAALLLGWSQLTYTEADNNVVVSSNQSYVNTTQRNGSVKISKSFNATAYAPGTGLPAFDPDNV
jgi:hypothetical protein